MHDETRPPDDAPADAPAAPPDPVPADPPPEPRQRWRLVVARSVEAPSQTQRDLADAWEAAIGGAGLALARTGDARSRPRISFGAPLPAGVAADAELIDVVLTTRWPAWRVREALAPVLPAGWRLVDLHDVWLAGPALAGRIAAADYRVVIAGADGVDVQRLIDACATLLLSRRVPRIRRKGDTTVTYDLRPLVLDARIDDVGPPPIILTRTR
ncbi:MAG: DUF2344 domain-containing protein, partial [Candidatus Limnocylindrales bacterium]